MATQVQFRGGSSTEHNSFTGAAREVTVDTTKNTVVIHDGSTAGGHALAKENNPTFTGNVGVGVSPSTKLHVSGSGTQTIRLENTSASGNAILDLKLPSHTFNVGVNSTSNYFADTGDNPYVWYHNSGERMRIDSAGRLMLGTAVEGEATADNLTIADSGHCGITLRSGTSSVGTIFFSDGTSGAAEYQGYVQYDHSANYLKCATAGSERMRIDSSGKVGIGTTAPLRQLHISSTQAEIAFTSATNGVASLLFGDGLTGTDVYRGYLQYNHVSDSMLFATAAGERMRIDSSGNVGIGSTNPQYKLHVGGQGYFGSGLNLEFYGQTQIGTIIKNTWSTPTASFIRFNNSAGNKAGDITHTGTTTVSYNTSSDYRLKENIVDMTNAVSRVKQLSPKRFNFIEDSDKTVDGFIAHEAQTVVPEAVTGEKDGEEMQGIDQSKLVPLLTAALQEAIAKIETLETKVAALESA